jgi:hypothetical protein
MGRRKAPFTQAALSRIFKASRKTGVAVRITLPDGTVIETTDKPKAPAADNDNSRIEANDFEDLLHGKNPTQVRK